MKNPGRSFRVAIILITSLFFLWGFALNLNPILIPHLKKACQLTDVQSAFIDSASYIAYFLMAIPAGRFIRRFGYKNGIVTGLSLFAAGAFLIYPASVTREYPFFLCALFIIASGLAFLETAANPYIVVLGEKETATQRLNLAQSFNGLAAFLAPLIGGTLILSGKSLSASDQSSMSDLQIQQYLDKEASAVQLPFIIIGIVVLLVAVLLFRSKLPEISETAPGSSPRKSSVLKEKKLMFGVLAQFFYVGAQVCVSSFFIRFAQKTGDVGEKDAALLLSLALLGFMAGRFIGTFLMRFVAPARLLLIYSLINIVLLCIAVAFKNIVSVYSLMGVEFFMSIMFPTIFSLSIHGLGNKTKEGSSLLIMSIVGGALFPVIMGKVSDVSSIEMAYLVPATCFIGVLAFAVKCVGDEKQKSQAVAAV